MVAFALQSLLFDASSGAHGLAVSSPEDARRPTSDVMQHVMTAASSSTANGTNPFDIEKLSRSSSVGAKAVFIQSDHRKNAHGSNNKAQKTISAQTLVSCCVSLFLVFVAGFFWKADQAEPQLPATPAAGATVAPGGRDYLLDNAKILAMMLVVCGHVLIHADMQHTTVMAMIKGVQMPMFSFVSGLCSQSGATPARVTAFFTGLFLPYVLWTYIGEPLFIKPMITPGLGPDTDKFNSNLHDIVTCKVFSDIPLCKGPWYLLSLSIWRVLSLFIWPHFDPAFVVVSTVGLCCYLGYSPLGTAACPGRVLDATVGFMPYFVIGWAFPLKKALGTFQSSHHTSGRVLAAVLVLLSQWLIACFERYVMLEKLPDAHFAYFHEISPLEGWDLSLYWTYRLTQVATDLACILPLLFFGIPRGETSLTWIGSGTLYVYLLSAYGISAEPASSFLKSLGAWADRETVKQSVVISFFLVYSTILTALLASRPVKLFFGLLVEPSWLKQFVSPLTAKPPAKAKV